MAVFNSKLRTCRDDMETSCVRVCKCTRQNKLKHRLFYHHYKWMARKKRQGKRAAGRCSVGGGAFVMLKMLATHHYKSSSLPHGLITEARSLPAGFALARWGGWLNSAHTHIRQAQNPTLTRRSFALAHTLISFLLRMYTFINYITLLAFHYAASAR